MTGLGYPAWNRHVWTAEELFALTEPDADGCWLWTGALDRGGYAMRVNECGRKLFPHRLAFRLVRGEIPQGLHIDHVCHTNDEACAGGTACKHRRCLNPDHMEPVTLAENSARGVRARLTHCPAGHEYQGANLIASTKADGQRQRLCRTCVTRRKQRRVDRARVLGILTQVADEEMTEVEALDLLATARGGRLNPDPTAVSEGVAAIVALRNLADGTTDVHLLTEGAALGVDRRKMAEAELERRLDEECAVLARRCAA